MAPSGAHGSAGFRWEKVGQVSLEAGSALLRLADTGQYFGRCDAILLTTDPALDPNLLTNAEIARWRRAPRNMEYTTADAPSLGAPLEITPGYTTLASASNGSIRLSFVRLAGTGEIVCKTDYYSAGSWRRFGSAAEDNRIALISRSDLPASVNYNGFYPAWDSTTASRTLTFEGTDYPVLLDGDSSNPFFTGTLSEPRAESVTKTAANCVKVTYSCGGLGTLTGYWTVPESGSHVEVRFLFKPARDGYYTLALHGAKGVADADARGGLMPPMFAASRLPQTPLTLFASEMTQCIAAVSALSGASTATAFVTPDLSRFPADWGSCDYSPAGFTLRNSRGELQPVALAPLPGMSDARVKANRTLEVRFNAGIREGGWQDALAYASENIFGVTDYRRPSGSSLSATIANIAGLLGDDTHSGWEPSLKGFWDIEADGRTTPTVVQASPLSIIGTATMTADEELYERRALPTIEYLLSRAGYRTRANSPAPLRPLASQFPTTLYEGIDLLTGSLNPWLAAIALPDGQTRQANGYFSTLERFRQELSAYRLTGDAARLDRARSLADTYASEILAGDLPDMAPGSFYNSQMIPDWTPLLDIYRLTSDGRYLEAAVSGAAHTLAGIKTWPAVAPGNLTVHPGGVYDGVTTIWWKGPGQYRLGFPRKAGDSPEHEVEAWSVSSVGLGIEQPATYFLRTAGKTVRPVYLSSWAPRLMELGALSGREIFETYARNAVIGRSENYPGYYATGHTDIPASPRFPYEGPDVSSIYYHHIPAHLGMLQDFLVTEFTTRTDGAVSFEAARQEGFVWFANNVYGRSRGSVDGEEAELFMPRGAVGCDDPAVNILCARNASTLFVMLTNDGTADAEPLVTLGAPLTASLADPADNTARVRIAPREVRILRFPARFPDYASAPTLADGMETIPTDTPAGSIRLFRIRSPFGWDSVYGYADCGEVKGLTVRAECGGHEVSEASSWPYEWSFARFGYDDPAPVKVTVLIDGKPVKTLGTTLGGTGAGIDGVRADTPAPTSARGIFTPDGRRVRSIEAPGVYIVDGRKVVRR